MSTIFDTTREKLTTLVKAFHTTYYPTMEVNYPNRTITDVEQAEDPFVKIEWTMKPEAMSLPYRNCVRVSGLLILNHYVREGSGSKVHNDYSDLLLTHLAMKTLDSVNFFELNPINSKVLKGFDSTMNAINYEIEYFNV